MTTSERAEREASLEVLLRCSPAVFLVHDLEEILTIERFWRENRDRIPIPAGLKDRIEAKTTAQMAAAVAFVFATSCYTSYLAARSPIPGARISFFNTMISIRLLNALLHLLQTLALRSYTPGTVTALLVSLPYSLYVFHRLCTEDLVAARDLYKALGLGMLLHTPVVLGAQTAGRALVRLLSRGD